jgi:sodium transport system permease protein
VRAVDPVIAVYAKEMRTLARDRHTILYSLCLPLFLYPALVWGVIQVLTYLRALDETVVSRVIIVTPQDVNPEAAQALLASLQSEKSLRVSNPRHPEAFFPGQAPESVAREWIRDETADAAVFLEPGKDPGAVRARIYQDGASESSRRAHVRIAEAIEKHRREKLVGAARALGETESFLETLRVEEVDVSTRQELAKYMVSLILPLLMIVMTALGALYPALDSTVGEKERGTLETTLLSPIARSAIVLGKYLAVVTFSFLSFFLNFLSMMLTLSHLRSQLKVEGFTLGIGSILTIVLAAVLLAFFLSAIMMALGFLARTFKEGQSYVTPVYLFSLFPVIATSSPDIALTPLLSIIPVVNISLLFREALQGRLQLTGVALTLAASAFYALLALAAAARLLRQEEYRTGAGFGPRSALARLLGSART